MREIIHKAITLFGMKARFFLSPCIRFLEGMFLNSNSGLHPPVFIVGAPRTGSTILYQALTNKYKVAYIDNMACAWHHNLRFGMWLSARRYGDAPHDNFLADHGNTKRFGGHAPSECGGFWYRWLPKDRHFVDYKDVTKKIIKEIQAEVYGVSSVLRKPVLFKNLNAGQRLRLIRLAFPNAKIIFIRRDPRFVVRSIIKAREKAGIKTGVWWSVMPKNMPELLSLPGPEMCSAQVYYLEKQIEEDLCLFPEENVKKVHYKNLDKKMIDELGHWIGVDARSGAKMPEFRFDSLSELKCVELKKLNCIICKYPFSKDIFL